MKALLLVALVSLSLTAQASVVSQDLGSQDVISAKKGKDKGKSEPAPKDDDRKGGGDEVDPRQGTYEGNDRDGGGYFDGGGYNDGGGMIGEIFYAPNAKTYPVTTTTTSEDRGDVIVYTTRVQEDISADETCTTISVVTVAKSTGKVISSESNEYCNRWPL